MAFELNITVLYKKDYADVMNIAQLKLFAAISAILICCIGCTSNTQDPLVGWKELGSVGWNGFEVEGERLPALSKSITDDYTDFIKKLPVHKEHSNRSESYWIDRIWVFEDGSGSRAVKMHFALDGNHWNYVLIYDTSGKRLKVIKFSSGRYAS